MPPINFMRSILYVLYYIIPFSVRWFGWGFKIGFAGGNPIMDKNLSVYDIEGPWVGEASTGLIRRCKDSWHTPIRELSDLMVATYLNQKIATRYMVLEAEKRLESFVPDETELFDGQLLASLKNAKNM